MTAFSRTDTSYSAMRISWGTEMVLCRAIDETGIRKPPICYLRSKPSWTMKENIAHRQREFDLINAVLEYV